MLQSVVGPPVGVGLTEMKIAPTTGGNNFKDSVPGEKGFDRTLQNRINAEERTKPQSPKEDQRKSEAQSSSESPRSQRPEQVDRSSSGKQKVKVSGREKAIQEFMDSFESEFKISPTRLVEAMAELEDSQLILSPEETAESVISQLDLNEEESKKAQSMYAGLLQKLQETPVSLNPAVATQLPDVPLNSGNTLQRSVLHMEKGLQKIKSADEVSDKFWGNSPSGVLTRMGATPERESSEMSNARLNLQELPPHLKGQMAESLSPEVMQKIAAKIEKLSEGVETPEDTSDLLRQLQSALNEAGVKAPVDLKAESSQSGNSSELLMPLMGQDSAQEGFDSNSGDQSSSDQSLSFLERDMGDKLHNLEMALKSLEGFQVELPTNTVGSQALGKAVPVVQVNHADPEMALQEVIKQAQVLVRDGGGEMKVQMNAEGMGNVQLKVHIQDGKVNLQMAAESHETKKMIEHGLADLKSSLAAQKLSVENIRVDVVEESHNQTQAQNNTNLNYNQQRDETRQFWNRFQDQFGALGRRDLLMDTTSTRGYGRERRDPLNPVESKVARQVDGKGSEINLVA